MHPIYPCYYLDFKPLFPLDKCLYLVLQQLKNRKGARKLEAEKFKSGTEITGDAITTTLKIEEAKVAGENWYVSILGNKGGLDYAKSALDTFKASSTDKGASTVKGAYGKAAGVEVGVYGYSFGVGFEAEAVKKPEFDAFKAYKLDLVAETKAFDFEGFNVKAGAQYSVEKEAALKKQKLTVLQVLFP